eukprot:g5441.t1
MTTGAQTDSQTVARKVAIVLGFCGSRYRGLQISYLDNTPTIEGELRKALWEAGAVRDAQVQLEKLSWSRSSRTDAGVSARVLVVACKVRVPVATRSAGHQAASVPSTCATATSTEPAAVEDLQEFQRRLNAYLAEKGDIRVFSVLKMPKGFDVKNAASWREYSYVLPRRVAVDAIKRQSGSAEVQQAEETTDEKETEAGPGEVQVTTGGGCDRSFPRNPTNVEEEEQRRRSMQPLDVERLQEALDCFLGVHSFHNFCNLKGRDAALPGGGKGKGKGKERKSNNPSAKRRKIEEEEAPETTAKEEGDGPDDVQRNVQPDLMIAARVDWAALLIRATNGDQFPALEDRYRRRKDEIFSRTVSSIYFFRVTDYDDELIEIRVRGQFFLYNQIRLMVGASVAYAMGLYDGPGDAEQAGGSSGLEKKRGLRLIQQALVSPLECQFPLAPGEGLCLYSAGFSQGDTRTGRMALDREQWGRCFAEPAAPEGQLAGGNVPGANPTAVADAERCYLFLPTESHVRAVDEFYREKVRANMLDLLSKVYSDWVLHSGLHRIRVSPEARLALQQSAARIAAESGSAKKSSGAPSATATTSTTGAADTNGDPAVADARASSVTRSREVAFANFEKFGSSHYHSCLPNRFATDLLVHFPFDFLPGAKLTDFQVDVCERLIADWNAIPLSTGAKAPAPWEREWADLKPLVAEMVAASKVPETLST